MRTLLATLLLLYGAAHAVANELYDAVADGDRAQVEKLLADGADVNFHTAEGTALQRAASQVTRRGEDSDKWWQIAKLLLDAGADYDIQSAIHLNDLERVRTIVNENPKAALEPQDYYNSPLRVAARDGREKICKLLLANKADPDDSERGCGYPILHDAVAHPKIVKLLIDAGIDVKQRITWRCGRTGVWIVGDDATALHFAAGEGAPETVTLLIDQGVDVFATAHDIADEHEQQTALEVAAIFGRADNALAILNHPKFKAADQKRRTQVLDTCLVQSVMPTLPHYKEKAERPKLVEVLLQNGANPNAKRDGFTAMELSTDNMHPTSEAENKAIQEIVAVLRKHGATLDLYSAVAIGDEVAVEKLLRENTKSSSARGPEGYPALHVAVDMGHANIVGKLLHAGCDVDIRNRSESTGNENGTALHNAAFWGRYEIAKQLIDAGADVNAKAENDVTPLDEAIRLKNPRVVKLLLERGAKIDSGTETDGGPEVNAILREFRELQKPK